VSSLATFKHPYAATILLVAAATLLGKTLLSGVAPANQVMLYLLVVVITGLWWGRGPTVLASALGVLAFDVFFVPPLYRLSVAHAEYIITFIALLVVALAIGTLTSRLRDHAAALQASETETAALYAFSRRMAAACEVHDVARAVVEHVETTFHQAAYLEVPGGLATGTPLTGGVRLPLRASHGEVGVLTIAGMGAVPARLIEALADQAAVALERAQLAETARRAQVLIEAEKLHDALLHSISHSLRTPLASIIGSLSALLDPAQVKLEPTTQRELAQTAREEAERLNGLVGNLLDMTRLEAGHLKLVIDWYDMADVIGAALAQAERVLNGRQVTADIPQDLPLVPLDQVLIVQVLDNLLNNAAKYSPHDSPIAIRVALDAGRILVSVADRGSGIPAAERSRVFDKFHRVDQPGSPAGTGLGLAICKGMVEAHHGRIWVDDREGGGTVATFSLPLAEARDEVEQGAGGR